ncbi:MAG: hypothetical protein P8X83_03455 [Nitrosopumilaceae archaeon]
MTDNTFLIITCKGTKTNGKVEKCAFLHEGNWGDDKLIEHQAFHDSISDENSFWLGFDSSLSFGKFSGRDGKQS